MRVLLDVAGFSDSESNLKRKFVEACLYELQQVEQIKTVDLFDSSGEIKKELDFQEIDTEFKQVSQITEDDQYDLLIVIDPFASNKWIQLKNISKIKAIVAFIFNLKKTSSDEISGVQDLQEDLQTALSLELLYEFDHIFVPSISIKSEIIDNFDIAPSLITVLPSKLVLNSKPELIPFEKRDATIVLCLDEESSPNSVEVVIKTYEDKKDRLTPYNDLSLLVIPSKCQRVVDDFTKIHSDIIYLPLLKERERSKILESANLIIYVSKKTEHFIEGSLAGTPFILVDGNLEGLDCYDISDFPIARNAEELRNVFEKILIDQELWSKLQNKCEEIGKSFLNNSEDFDLSERIRTILTVPERMVWDSKVALFGCLPPYESGIARYNLDWLSSSNETFCFFTSADNFIKFSRTVDNADELNVFSDNLFGLMNRKYELKDKIFIIGNSYHNIPTLFNAIKFGDKNAWFYVHEAYLKHLLIDYCRFVSVSFNEIFHFFYPNQSDGTGLKILLSMTPITKFIVNSERCRQLILDETIDKVNIEVQKAFLPLPILPHVPSTRERYKEELVIGTFGIPSDLKMTNVIVNAVQILVELGFSVRLLVAGFQAKNYFAGKSIPNFIEVISSPSYFELLTLEKTVDLAVQLRKICNGESSGVISELLSLGTPIITVKDLADEKSASYMKVVKSSITPKILSEIIIEDFFDSNYFKENNHIKESTLLKNKFSEHNLTKRVLNIITFKRD